MNFFLVFASVILVTSGRPHSSASIGSPYSSIQQAVTAQFSSSTPASQQQQQQQSLRGSASIQQPLYAVPASLLQQASNQQQQQQQQDYNSVVQDNSYSNPILQSLQSYGAPQQQAQAQQQPQQQQQQSQQSQQLQQIQQQINTNQPLSYNQYTTLLENGNPPLHSTPFHVTNDYTETPDNNGNGNGGNSEGGKQTVVIHKHIHMHYFVRGAELPELPPAPEEKTFVYVLLKKPDGPPSIVFPESYNRPTVPSKPEVYFIRYKDSKSKQQSENDKVQLQQQQSSQGPINPTSISNNHNNNINNDNISPPPIPSSQYGARIAKSTSS